MTFPAPIFAAQSADISLQKACASPGGAIVKDKLFLSLTTDYTAVCGQNPESSFHYGIW